MLIAYDHATSRQVARPASGTKRVSALERLSWAIPESSNIAEIAAALSPTTEGLYVRAAMIQ